MTGPEHYKQGELLLAELDAYAPDEPYYLGLCAAAQAHFAAAQAAASALCNYVPDPPDRDLAAWCTVAGVQPSAADPEKSQ